MGGAPVRPEAPARALRCSPRAGAVWWRLLLGRKAMTNLDSELKSRDATLPTKVCTVIATAFPTVTHGCESWTIEKAELQRIDAFKLVLEKTLESPLDNKEFRPVNPKRNQP